MENTKDFGQMTLTDFVNIEETVAQEETASSDSVTEKGEMTDNPAYDRMRMKYNWKKCYRKVLIDHVLVYEVPAEGYSISPARFYSLVSELLDKEMWADFAEKVYGNEVYSKIVLRDGRIVALEE